jgi:ferredoxin-NADP reductase
VQRHLRSLWRELEAASLRPPDVWACGVRAMVLEVRELLESLGVERSRLHVESYG